MKTTNVLTLAALVLVATSAGAADDAVRQSSSIYLPAWKKADVTIPFDVAATGHRFAPTWGLDQAWINEQNLKKGINHMGKENIGIGRSAFRFTKPLVNDSALNSDQTTHLKQRATIFNQVSTTLPIVLTADQEAGTDEYYVKNRTTVNDHWATMINSHVHWMQQNTKHPVVGISPFNEGDYWTNEEGATAAKQWQVAKLLKEKYPRCADIAMVGGNTLNDDKALDWYSPGKTYYDWGNTHQLAGSMDNFVKFYQQLQKDGKVGYADEMHNVGEAMIGLEYGMTVGIWWGFDSRARGEFCQLSRNGVRLAYAEHRNNWTAASVYRHDDGRVRAFVGSSERQAATTTYEFVSTARDVYYEGYGPVRAYVMEMPGGNGYQKGQTNAERVIDVTWGDDVAPSYIAAGVYKLVNKATGNVAAVNASNIAMQKYTGTKQQQWNVALVSPRIGGDYSFYVFSSVANDKTRMNLENFSTNDGANIMAYSQNDTPSSNEQWYFEYAGQGYYYVRNRESALYLSSANSTTNNNVNVLQRKLQTADALRDRQLWRLLPVDVTYDTEAPAQPQGLTAEAHAVSVSLAWDANGEADCDGYMVLRAEKATGEWNTIARKLAAPRFTDNTCRAGTLYIYKVKAIDRSQNLSEASATVEAGPTGERTLTACWPMDENLYDATVNMQDAALCGTPTYVADGKQGTSALRLAATAGNYLQLPYSVADSDELTVAMWVRLRSSSAWQRLFDFGTDTDHYLFLTPNNGSVMTLALKNGGDEQTLKCKSRLATQVWKHVAVTFGSGVTTIYVDGEVAAQSESISISPRDVGAVQNFIGRSQFTADPLLTADIDDVRLYNYAVTAGDVKTIMDAGTLTAVGHTEADAAANQHVYGLDGVRRPAMRQGLNIVKGKKVMK